MKIEIDENGLPIIRLIPVTIPLVRKQDVETPLVDGKTIWERIGELPIRTPFWCQFTYGLDKDRMRLKEYLDYVDFIEINGIQKCRCGKCHLMNIDPIKIEDLTDSMADSIAREVDAEIVEHIKKYGTLEGLYGN